MVKSVVKAQGEWVVSVMQACNGRGRIDTFQNACLKHAYSSQVALYLD